MALLLAITTFLFMDQNLMAPNLSDIAKAFDFTDKQRDTKLGGEISLSLFLVGAPVSLVVGFQAVHITHTHTHTHTRTHKHTHTFFFLDPQDRVNRKKLYSAVVLIGEVGCLATYFVTKYWQLFVLRALTGVALGGALPLIFSMIGDMYPAEERSSAASYVGLSTGLGVGFGQALAAYVGGVHGWRLPFVLVAAPCLIGLVSLCTYVYAHIMYDRSLYICMRAYGA